MNTGQMLISIAAMALLSMVILNVNRNNLTNTTAISETKYQILAVSLANAFIEEAFSKSFDENSTNNKIVSELKDLSSSLKADPGENLRKDFDDFDDYNNYNEKTSSDSTYDYVEMDINCKVYYVDPAVSLDSVNYKTWNKKITVSVTSPYIAEGETKITLSKINSHYYFR